jgi:hypothetical protein
MSSRYRRAIVLGLLTYALGLIPFYLLTPVHQYVPGFLASFRAVGDTITPTRVTGATGPPPAPSATPLSGGAGHVEPDLVPTAVAASSIATPVASATAAPTATPVADAAWSLLYAAKGDLWVTNGAQTTQLTRSGRLSQPSLNGNTLVYVERGKNYSDLWLARPGVAPRRITHNFSSDVTANHWVAQPVLLPGARAVEVLSDENKDATGVGDLAIWRLDLPSGVAHQVTRPPPYTGGDQDVAVDPRQPDAFVFTRYAYAESGQLVEGLTWLNPAGSNDAIGLTTSDHSSRQASFAPDGGLLAFVQTDGPANNDLYVARIETTPQPQLAGQQQVATGTIAEPAWRPDGAELAYVALADRRFQIWTRPVSRNADGTLTFGPPRQVTSGDGVDSASRPVWLTSAIAADLPSWLSGAGR